MGFFQRLFQQLKQVWSGMTMARRAGLIALTGVCLAAIVGVGIWASQPDYRILFAGLAPEDAGAITGKLQTQNTPFRLSDNGTTILVPADQVQQVRLSLAMEGLPEKGGKGWDLFDSSTLGSTALQQHVNYVRALQAELAKSIMKFEPVALARVHIVRPEPTPFIKDQKPTTASVVLKLKAGASLPRNKAAGIQAFVARSVEGLLPENVSVMDTTGRVLSDNRAANDSSGVISTQLEYQRDLETYLAAKAEDVLNLALGANRAAVRVTLNINFKKIQETKETYNNEDKAVLKEVLLNQKETNSGGAAGSGSPTGAAPKKPGGAKAGGDGSNRTEENIQTEYAVSKVVQKFEDRVGNIERISVAAIVDLPKGDAKTKATLLMTSQAAEDLIKQAVGFKTGRDQITLTNVKLASKEAPENLEAEWLESQKWQNYTQLARQASLGIAALVVFGLGWMIIRRLRLRENAARPEQAPLENDRGKDEVASALERDPEGVARVLGIWLAEKDQNRKAAA